MRRSSLRSQPGREKVEFFSLLLREVSKLKSTILSLAFVYYIYIIDTHTYIYIYVSVSIRVFSLIFITRRSLILLLQFVIRFYVRYILFALSPASNLYPNLQNLLLLHNPILTSFIIIEPDRYHQSSKSFSRTLWPSSKPKSLLKAAAKRSPFSCRSPSLSSR